MNQLRHVAPFIKQLFLGNMLSRIIPLLALPALSRLYPPSAYGQLALYLSVFIVVSPLLSLELQHEIALINNKKKSKMHAEDLISLCNQIFPLLALLISVAYLLFFKDKIDLTLLSLIIIAPYFNAVSNILQQYLVGQKQYKAISTGKTLGAVINILVAFLFLIVSNDARGLILSHCIGLASSMLAYLYFSDLKARALWRLSNRANSKRIIAKYQAYPKYILPKVFINNLLNQMPVYFVQAQFGLQTVGLFSRSRQMLDVPTSTISNSSGEVFKKEAASQTSATGSCRGIMRNYIVAHALLALIGVALTIVFAPALFVWLFGQEWRFAGTLAQYLAPVFALRLITAPIGSIFFIRKKQKELFWIDTLLSVAVLLIFLHAQMYNIDLLQCLIGYVTAYSAAYIYGAIRSYQLSEKAV